MTNSWTPSSRHREPAELMRPIVDPAGWYPDDLRAGDGWIYRLSDAEIAEILEAVAAIEASGMALMDVGRAEFVVPTLAAGLADVREELLEGRGFAVIRGLPVAGRTRAQTAIAFWGIASHLGETVSQNGKGHLLGHVLDLGYRLATSDTRGYHTNDELSFHSDRCDILGLCCLQPARSGGQHRICSAVTIYNEILKRRPDLAKELTWRFYRSRRGEIPPGETEPWVRQPVFSVAGGYFAARGAGGTVFTAQRFEGVPKLTEAQREAIAMFEDLAAELAFDIEFAPGDISFVLNHVIQHSRTAYEDWPEPERMRHLLRIWLDTGGARPLHPDVAREIRGVVVDGTVLSTPLEPA